MHEFDMIEQYFAPLGKDGFKDDAAVLQIPARHELVVTSDTLNEGTHFWIGEEPAFIAHKALRVNLSDLAAMGADPFCYQLNIAYPKKPSEDWLRKFTGALAADQKEFGIFCSGGDTTSINGSLSISITALGLAPTGSAVKRSGAQAGDAVVVTGSIGDAFIGLEILRGNLKSENPAPFLNAYKKPYPATKIAVHLRAHAHAAADISDGLLADLGHICAASCLSAVIELDKIPFSCEAFDLATPEQLLTGGDDYRLVLAMAPEDLPKLVFPHFVIGHFAAGEGGVKVLDKNGKSLSFSASGWQHF
jgi:thiamine-monophosphate kinase